MELTNTHCYAALCSHDKRFDGRFFVGVASTGIYCRPVCTVRTPKFENCSFYPSAAAAEQAGFRPCLKCRPELAPGFALIDARQRYASVAARMIEEGYLTEHSCTELAARLGITDRHLRRVFMEQFGVAPIEFAQSQRLLTAKRLLMDTALPIGEVALSAGFGSQRRFNETFNEHYRLKPSDLRREVSSCAASCSELIFHQSYRAPYDWPWMLEFLHKRAVEGLEAVVEGRYLRTLSIIQAGQRWDGWFSVTPDVKRQTAKVQISSSLARVVPLVLLRIRQLFDLDAVPEDINLALGELALNRPGLRLPGTVSSYEFAMRAVLEQQISTKAAARVISRLVSRWGRPVETPFAELRFLFPEAEKIAALSIDELCSIGLTQRRALCLQTLSAQVTEGHLQLDHIVDIEQGLERLCELPGIGRWTAQYIAMRAWNWPDAFLHTDYVIRQRFPDTKPARILELSEKWRPWRSYATLHLWHQTDS